MLMCLGAKGGKGAPAASGVACAVSSAAIVGGGSGHAGVGAGDASRGRGGSAGRAAYAAVGTAPSAVSVSASQSNAAYVARNERSTSSGVWRGGWETAPPAPATATPPPANTLNTIVSSAYVDSRPWCPPITRAS